MRAAQPLVKKESTMSIAKLYNRKLGKLILFITLSGLAMLSMTACNRDINGEAEQGKNEADSSTAVADSAAKADSVAREDAEARAVPVVVAGVERGEVFDFILQNASVDTEDAVDVYSRLTGEVVELAVEEGSRVKKGALLCRLDDEDYRLALEMVKVAFEKSKAEYSRIEAMYGKQLASEKELEEAKFNFEQRRIDREQKALELRRTRVRAPIDGVVSNRHIKLGQRVTVSNPLFRIVNLEEKITVIHLPESETSRVSDGQRAYLSTENLPGERFEARIKRISPTVDPESGTFKVTVGLRDPENLLRPGMFVAVHIVTDTHGQALLIPKVSVTYENGQPYAFFVEADTLVRRVLLEKGYANEDQIEVLKGIAEKDRVVVLGQSGLKSGDRIKITTDMFNDDDTVASKESEGEQDTL